LIYQRLRRRSRVYAIGVMLPILFIVFVTFLVMMPIGALLGVTLGPLILLGHVRLDRRLARLARSKIEAGECPWCESAGLSYDEWGWTCARCKKMFTSSGKETYRRPA
jgi:hypothetical protein